jgi:hypothetical protein
MKPLKEIGKEMWIEDTYKHDPEDAYLIAHGAPQLMTCDEVRGAGMKVFVLTEIERRELVRDSIYRFIMDRISNYHTGDGESLGKNMEKFFKENGLLTDAEEIAKDE